MRHDSPESYPESRMPNPELTRLLLALKEGREESVDNLIDTVYPELRRLAGSMMRRERSDHTLQPTALVHEAFVRLLDGEGNWENRAHFFGAAATAMRRILVEHARGKAAKRRGGRSVAVTLDEAMVQKAAEQLDLLIVDDAMTALAAVDPRLARVVELRYFAGCSLEEVGRILGLSLATVKRDWSYARTWLADYMLNSARTRRT